MAGLFTRQGWSIDSLAVGETSAPDISWMTIVARWMPENHDRQVRHKREKESACPGLLTRKVP
ncbi:hypothetical protein [Streptomyces sp. NBC_01187]|uniref:hypothetical protein n=1 Tax=unclassified Streptomyces TaxID=2593676 RepID=UPI0038671002